MSTIIYKNGMTGILQPIGYFCFPNQNCRVPVYNEAQFTVLFKMYSKMYTLYPSVEYYYWEKA